jgi:hypothetical protein
MNWLFRAIGLSLAMMFVAATQSGCLLLAGAAGVVSYAYADGDLTGYEDADLPRTMAATKLAMNDLKYEILSTESDTEGGKVEARVGTENKAVIHLIRKSEKVTKVKVRIGTFGDETASREILNKLEGHLNDPALRASARVP